MFLSLPTRSPGSPCTCLNQGESSRHILALGDSSTRCTGQTQDTATGLALTSSKQHHLIYLDSMFCASPFCPLRPSTVPLCTNKSFRLSGQDSSHETQAIQRQPCITCDLPKLVLLWSYPHADASPLQLFLLLGCAWHRFLARTC